MRQKKQSEQTPSVNFVTIGEAARILGWSIWTIRRNLAQFERYPHAAAISRTPGGHIRLLRDAVYWVQGASTAPRKADDLIKHLL